VTKRYSGKASAADLVASWLRKHAGINLDPLRLAEGLAAVRERSKAEFADYNDHIRALVTIVRRCDRSVAIEEQAWRRSPSADNLARAQAAQRSRKATEDALLEAVNYDKAQFRALLNRS
jgi:hypothetical protein